MPVLLDSNVTEYYDLLRSVKAARFARLVMELTRSLSTSTVTKWNVSVWLKRNKNRYNFRYFLWECALGVGYFGCVVAKIQPIFTTSLVAKPQLLLDLAVPISTRTSKWELPTSDSNRNWSNSLYYISDETNANFERLAG